MYKNIDFIKNNFVDYEDYAICGGRGWSCPNDNSFSEHDNKIYLRELKRMTMSFESAIKAGYSRFVMTMHYPPTNDKKEKSGFIDIIEFYKVEKVIYGHMHDAKPYDYSFEGQNIATEYFFVAGDYLDFKPFKIL